MEKVYFYSNKEVISFCERLFKFENEINIQWKTDKNWGNEINFLQRNVKLDVIINCFVHVFITFRLKKMIKTIIQETYYYTNKDEIGRIYELTAWLLEEVKTGSIPNERRISVEQLLYNLFKQNLTNKKVIHFDSVIQFQLKNFQDYLIHLIGLAIDEFKREEEYQNFIHSIREYISQREPKHDELHILQGNRFLFFDRKGRQYTKRELQGKMEQEPLYMIGLDDEEMNLAPLIALLPSHIYIYGRDPSEAKTLSIINIFQEKVTFVSYDKFPFTRKKDKS